MQITIGLFTTFAIITICVIPIFAFLFKCAWWKLSLFSLLMGVLFLPASCTTIWETVDRGRFGRFDFHRFADVDDFRVERYLPSEAKRISIYKLLHGNGYIARYKITEEELLDYLDVLWETGIEYSVFSKEEAFSRGRLLTDEEQFDLIPDILDHPASTTTYYESPTEGDGGGARYYYVPETGEAIQFAGYW